MSRILFFTFVMIMISACIDSNRSAIVFPTKTLLPLPTISPILTFTATPSKASLPPPTLTPVPPSLILDDFPLAVGATWKYSAKISFQDPKDYEKMAAWTGIITDKVIDRKSTAEGKIVFSLEENLEPTPPPDVWRHSRTYEYTIKDDGIFEGLGKIYQWPLSNNLSWKWTPDFEYYTNATSAKNIEIPYGKLNGCYLLLTVTNPDVSENVFCPKIGFVAHYYKHFGTLQNESIELISYEAGQ